LIAYTAFYRIGYNVAIKHDNLLEKTYIWFKLSVLQEGHC